MMDVERDGGMPLMIPGAFDARVPRVAPLDATPESEPRARARAAALGLASLTDPERATFGTRLWHCLRHPGDFQTLWRDHLPRS